MQNCWKFYIHNEKHDVYVLIKTLIPNKVRQCVIHNAMKSICNDPYCFCQFRIYGWLGEPGFLYRTKRDVKEKKYTICIPEQGEVNGTKRRFKGHPFNSD
jgi:hypothetical protein